MSICIFLCLIVLLVFWKCCQSGQSFAERGGRDADFPDIPIQSLLPLKCENSGQGRLVISDSKGFVCDRYQVNSSSGCCNDVLDIATDRQRFVKDLVTNGSLFGHHQRSTKQFECSNCNPDDSCCLDFESCISCCLKPSNLQRNLRRYLSLDIFKPSTAGKVSPQIMHSQFAYCKHVCRTNSLSLQAENSYRGFHNNCFGLHAAPIEQLPINSDFAGVPDIGK